MDWLEWLENSEDSSLISSCRLWTRREARCLYSWCIADSSSLIRGTCKNTTHHVIPRSWAAQLLGSQSIPEQNPLTLLPAAQSPAFYSFVLFAPGNSSRCGKCIHLTLTAFTENKSILKATSMAWMSLHRQTAYLESEILFPVLLLSLPSVLCMCCTKVCNSQTSIISSLPLNKNGEVIYTSVRKKPDCMQWKNQPLI